MQTCAHPQETISTAYSMHPIGLDTEWVPHSDGLNLLGASPTHLNNASNGFAEAKPSYANSPNLAERMRICISYVVAAPAAQSSSAQSHPKPRP